MHAPELNSLVGGERACTRNDIMGLFVVFNEIISNSLANERQLDVIGRYICTNMCMNMGV